MLKSEFLEKAKLVHGDKYIYSNLPNEFNVTDKITIICPLHGNFQQLVFKHLRGQKCKKCSDIEKGRKLAEKAFINFKEKASKKFSYKYDYSKANYIDNHTPIEIVCPIHGVFKQTPHDHFKSPIGCQKCVLEKMSLDQASTTEEFIKKARQIHGNKYDYSKVKYINNRIKVCIRCPIHGEFWQTPDNHLYGKGCKKCSYEKLSSNKFLTTNEYIEKAKLVHGDKYDYSETIYNGMKNDVVIICPIHGKFKQNASNHTHGKGCPKCNMKNKSHLEKEVLKKISNYNYIHQQNFSFLKNGKGKLTLDFYLPQFKIAIECQGKQHFIPIDFFKGDEGFKKCRNRDIRKKQLCEENGIKIFYFSHEDFDEFLGEKVYHDVDELIKEIVKMQC